MYDWIDFKQIKQSVTIEAVLRHYDIVLRRVNQHSFRGKCPLPTHSSEKSKESFSADIGNNIWACQSNSCAATRQGKKGGNVFDFVATMENCSIRDAALKLQNWLLSGPPTTCVNKKEREAQAHETLIRKNQSGASEEEVNKPLAFTLKGIDFTHPYLQRRELKEETARQFGIGFFPGRGSMNSRVVIPISNERGELVAYAGRAIDETDPKYKLPSGFKKSEVLFNLHRVLAITPESINPVIVVEGFFDCAKVHQAGFPHVVALMGSSLSETQQEFLCQFQRVILCLDGDDAGRLATQVIAPQLMSRTFVKVVHLSDGQQPDQLSSDEIKTVLSI